MVIISVLLTYLMLEVGYRVLQYNRLSGQSAEFAFWWVDAPLFDYDADLGYRYIPNQERRRTLTDQFDQGIHANQFRINNARHISWEDDTRVKPPDEFRIAIIGDSFAASLFNETPWSDTLEKHLNADDDLKQKLGIATFDVINFGMEATGIAQFDDIYQHDTRLYQPDLVLVNFISYDISRKFVWRDTVELHVEGRDYQVVLSCASQPVALNNPECSFGDLLVLPHEFLSDSDALAQMRRDLFQADLERRPWFGFYPELLAATIGHRFGLTPHLERGHAAVHEFTDPNRALQASYDALESIRQQHPYVIILHNPMHHEIVPGEPAPITQELMARYPELAITSILDFLPYVDVSESEQWFNLPFDNHFSEAGAEVYAQAVYTHLLNALGDS